MADVALKDGIAELPGTVAARTYIAVTFWGPQFRRLFLDCCLASLMAPGNIPAIRHKSEARLLIATRDDDWQALQSEPIFIAAQQHIECEHVRHEAPLPTPQNQKMSLMSSGHKLLARRMSQDGARGVIVYPDMILADGALERIEQIAESGYKVILCLAVRFANEGLVDALKRLGLSEPGKPLIIGPQPLARLTIEHMHSEAARLEFDADLDDRGACSFFWVVSPGRDLLFHAANWAPMLIDYSSLGNHDDSTFDKWTLDGDYIARNFSDIGDIYVVRDTTELFITTVTPEAQATYPRMHLLPYRFAFLRTALKIVRAREYLDAFDVLDDVKKQCFRIPIRVRGGAAPETAWRAAEQRASVVVERINNLGVTLTVCCALWSIVRRCLTPLVRFRRHLRDQRRHEFQAGG